MPIDHTIKPILYTTLCRVIAILFLMGFMAGPAWASTGKGSGQEFENAIHALSALQDRSTGSPGCNTAADYIKSRFKAMGFDDIETHKFSTPVRMYKGSALWLPNREKPVLIHPLRLNAISPDAMPAKGLSGPLIYGGSGELHEFNGRTVEGAIVLLEMDSGKNWLNAAALGARALIYVDRGSRHKKYQKASPRPLFEEKLELTPIRFPRFWMPVTKARDLFGSFENGSKPSVLPEIRLTAGVSWKKVQAENIYTLVPGKDSELGKELVIVEAFYDSTAWVPGLSPGADEACSLASLLSFAADLKENPPQRSVLLVATSGHAQTLSGMREMIWSIRVKSKFMKKMKKRLSEAKEAADKHMKALDHAEFSAAGTLIPNTDLMAAMSEQIKTEIDLLSRQLMHLRLIQVQESEKGRMQALSKRRRLLRRFGWQGKIDALSREESQVLEALLPKAKKGHKRVYKEAKAQLKLLKSAKNFRKIAKSREITAIVSLHLSSQGSGVGAFNKGWLYPLKSKINRVSAYRKMDEVLKQGVAGLKNDPEIHSLFQDTLRPSRLHSWKDYFIDRPPLGGEVSALAGYMGVSLVTVNDARARWGTPSDLPENVNLGYAQNQNKLVTRLLQAMTRAPVLKTGKGNRKGFATVTGRVNFLRHGELFADQAAPDTMILAYQGPGRYHAMVDAMGHFYFKGIADKKHVLDKLIIEGYRFDPKTGETVWAIDKKRTGKSAYRLKMKRREMETDLIMFACREMTVFNLLEPRSFRYMTKIELIDGRREAPPVKYWYSRIDTRSSTIASIYLEPRSRLKMILSDTVLRKKLILTNATENRPDGVGYLIEEWPSLYHTRYHVARDMWALLDPRVTSLESHGIFDEKIRGLQAEGTTALKLAEKALAEKAYDQFSEAAGKSWALASRVYDHVEETQKDVLFGVLFYIALFVPFAFCLERLAFSYTNIYKRITAFSIILFLLIGIIYKVHPAFQLAYSPFVVIIAFFIIGLSFLVLMIIFFRFEEEMVQLQRRASHVSISEISRWKAFLAAFFLGISNLRRRRLRTALTCITLVILTFTIMSFTSVKTMRRHARLLFQDNSPYQGFLLKNVNWQDLPYEAYGILSTAFNTEGVTVAPRVWLEADDRTRTRKIPVSFQNRVYEASAVMGLSHEEPRVTAIDQILVAGRWFDADDRHAVILSERMADGLGLDPQDPDARVSMWGVPFTVTGVFSGDKLHKLKDLDMEPLTPVTFPKEVSTEMTEVEMEALESGEDVLAFQSRYQHVPEDLTVILPHQTLMALGGHLKGVTIAAGSLPDVRKKAEYLVDRFGLSLFSGEGDGIFLYRASDALSYSGVPNIIIPLIIAMFIVLNTMIGSVYERKREIGIYTSVGLAPVHVSFLFIAEALAFAVLSVVLGYILAQAAASLFAGTALWSGVTVNYSSLAGVGAMLLVIFVVLVSVIYPSKTAADLAIPDVNRSWTMPETGGSVIDITLPFLLKHDEQDGVCGYLFSYFQSHKDVSHGLFSTGNMEIGSTDPMPGRKDGTPDHRGREAVYRHLGLKVWLAPFDLGIMQQVDLIFSQAKSGRDFLEIKVQLTRRSGEANVWWRINKRFLNSLRKQLLVWRSLDASAQKAHREMFEKELNIEHSANIE